MRKITKIALFVSSAAILAGCHPPVKPVNFANKTEKLKQKLMSYYVFQEPLQTPMGMYYAMARAVKYNLDNRVKQAESIFYSQNVNLTKFEMLPTLATQAGYIGRNNDYGVFGRNTKTPSISQSRDRFIYDIQGSWNLLDFGIGYLNTKQDADRYLISIEQRRRVMQTVLRDVRYAYWRAYIHQNYKQSVAGLSRQVASAVAKSKKSEILKVQKPLVSLEYQDRLMDNVRDISLLNKQLATARTELAGLMNYPNVGQVRLRERGKYPRTLPVNFPKKLRGLEETALLLRPSLREAVYTNRISLNEVRKARLQMLPGLVGQVGYNYDSNRFLLNNNWVNYGATLTWDIIKLFSGPHAIARAKAALKVENVRQMAKAVAVITEVDMAYVNYREAKREFELEKKIKKNKYGIYLQLRKLFEAKQANELELVQTKSGYILAQIRADVAYANLQNAAGILMESIGYDPFPTFDLSESVQAIKAKLKQTFEYLPDFNAVRNLAAISMPELYVVSLHDQDKQQVKHIAQPNITEEIDGKLPAHAKPVGMTNKHGSESRGKAGTEPSHPNSVHQLAQTAPQAHSKVPLAKANTTKTPSATLLVAAPTGSAKKSLSVASKDQFAQSSTTKTGVKQTAKASSHAKQVAKQPVKTVSKAVVVKNTATGSQQHAKETVVDLKPQTAAHEMTGKTKTHAAASQAKAKSGSAKINPPHTTAHQQHAKVNAHPHAKASHQSHQAKVTKHEAHKTLGKTVAKTSGKKHTTAQHKDSEPAKYVHVVKPKSGFFERLWPSKA